MYEKNGLKSKHKAYFFSLHVSSAVSGQYMEDVKKGVFEKTKDVLKTLEGYSLDDCKEIVRCVSNHLEYRSNRVVTERPFNYEELLIA